jgi:hypothetical protein
MNDEIDALLAALPARDVDPQAARRIARRARAVLEGERRRIEGPAAWRRVMRWWDAVIEPAWVAITTVVWVAWAVGVIRPLLWGG